MTEQVVDAFLAGDGAALRELLPPDATFHSPVADYEGRERAGAVLTALTQVIGAPRATSRFAGPDEAAAFFTAEIDGNRIDGVFRVAANDVTLMIRPLKTLLIGVERMKQILRS
jgi:hypothetical protein